MKWQCLDLVAAFLLRVSSAVCTLQPRPHLCRHAFASLLFPPSVHGCAAYGPVLILPRRAALRRILFCTGPPPSVGALSPMPAWPGVMSDRGFFVHHTSDGCMHVNLACVGGRARPLCLPPPLVLWSCCVLMCYPV